MEAKNLLQRYKAGERDFQGANLRGKSFKGENLSGANFCGADIRGANFSKAKLEGASFRQTTAGLQSRWLYILGFIVYLATCINGLIIEYVSALALSIIPNPEIGIIPAIVISPFIIYFISLFFEGIQPFLHNIIFVTGCMVGGLILIFIFVPSFSKGITVNTIVILISSTILSSCLILAKNSAKFLHHYFSQAMGLVFLVTWLFALLSLSSKDNNIGIVLLSPFLTFLSLSNSFWIGILIASSIFLIVFLMGIPFVLAYFIDDDISYAILSTCLGIAAAFSVFEKASYLSIIVSLSVIFLSIYMTRKFLSIRPQNSPIELLAVAIACIGGTSFQQADLTNASFSQSDLEFADFRQAKLMSANFNQAKNIDRIRSSDSYFKIFRNYILLFIKILTDTKVTEW